MHSYASLRVMSLVVDATLLGSVITTRFVAIPSIWYVMHDPLPSEPCIDTCTLAQPEELVYTTACTP